MSQCVPNWEVEERSDTPSLPFYRGPNSHPTSEHPPQQPTWVECDVAELTWENGHLAMHGLGGREKPRQGGTLESIVRQAAGFPPAATKSGDELYPWFEHQRAAARSLAMDALVPCYHQTLSAEELSTRVPGSGGPTVVSLARVGSCTASRDDGPGGRKRRRAVASIDVQSESLPTTAKTADLGPDSPDNTDYHDAGSSPSRPRAPTISTLFIRGGGQRDDEKKKKRLGRCSTSTKRSRAAAIHNQSERIRRDRINQSMKTLQKLVPNSSKMDKASMLVEVIEYLKQLQAQIQMMSTLCSIPHMMMPMAMQRMQMAMMAQMGVGFGMEMGMGHGHDALACTEQPAGLPQVVHPSAADSTATAFIPMATPWDAGLSDQLGIPSPPAAIMSDPMSAFLAGQTQPMTLDAYNRLATLYQHLHQQTGTPPSRT